MRYYKNLFARQDARSRKQLFGDIIAGSCNGWHGSQVIYVVAILVGSEVFQCTSLQKSLLVAGIFFGLFLNILYENFAHRFFKTRNQQAIFPALIGGIASLGAAYAPNADYFVGMTVLFAMSQGLRTSAETSIWQANHSEEIRGQLLTFTMWCYGLCSISCSALAGYLLDVSLSYYRLLFISFCFTSFISMCVYFYVPRVAIPSRAELPTRNPIKVLNANREFAMVLLAWFFAGFGMHFILVQKTEYMLFVEQKFSLSNLEIAFFASIITESIRLMCMPFFARLFDKIDFITLRIIISTLFLGFIHFYFNSETLFFIAFGAFLHGVGQGGGQISWKLGVTKFAKPEETGVFMSIHTCLTGVRGIMAPYLGYKLLEYTSFAYISDIAFTLMCCSIAVLLLIKLRMLHSITECRSPGRPEIPD